MQTIQENQFFNTNNSTIPQQHHFNLSAIGLSALVALGLSFLLNIFTSGLGLTLFTQDHDGNTALVLGSFIWLFISYYFVMFVAGLIAGSISRPQRCAGVVNAFAGWALALIITVALFSPVVTGALGIPVFSPHTQSEISAQTQSLTNSASNKESINKLGAGTLGIFLVFLSGALGSCAGGYVGSREKNKTVNNRFA